MNEAAITAARQDKKQVDDDDFDTALYKSEATGKRIDEEIQEPLIRMAQKAEDILIRHRHQLDALVRELMLQETLENEEIQKIFGRESV